MKEREILIAVWGLSENNGNQGKFRWANSMRPESYLSILCKMFKVDAGESQSALVYPCSVSAKQISILNKIARGRAMSAPENSLLFPVDYRSV